MIPPILRSRNELKTSLKSNIRVKNGYFSDTDARFFPGVQDEAYAGGDSTEMLQRVTTHRRSGPGTEILRKAVKNSDF